MREIRCKHPHELNEVDIGGVGKVPAGVIVVVIQGRIHKVYIPALSKAEYICN